jgi:hypothetical protein
MALLLLDLFIRVLHSTYLHGANISSALAYTKQFLSRLPTDKIYKRYSKTYSYIPNRPALSFYSISKTKSAVYIVLVTIVELSTT